LTWPRPGRQSPRLGSTGNVAGFGAEFAIMLPAPAVPPPLAVGDQVPDIGLVDAAGRLISLHHQTIAGQPLVLFLFPASGQSAVARELAKFAEIDDRIRALGGEVIAICREPRPAGAAAGPAKPLPFRLLSDPSGALFDRFGDCQRIGRGSKLPGCQAIIVDPALRILQKLEAFGEVRLAVPALRALERGAAAQQPTVVSAQAPVLLIPGVFDAELCRDLIAGWSEGQRFTGGVSVSGREAALTVEYGHKRREDLVLPEGPLFDRVRARTVTQVFPDMIRAFQYQPTRHEAYRIGCYDAASGGFFRRHRDNRTPHTAHRRYAITFLLNDDFEGGYLRFPEYGPMLYRPPAGGAIVFSCNLLHEVTDVTVGRRFVVVTFFYGEAEAAEIARRGTA